MDLIHFSLSRLNRRHMSPSGLRNAKSSFPDVEAPIANDCTSMATKIRLVQAVMTPIPCLAFLSQWKENMVSFLVGPAFALRSVK